MRTAVVRPSLLAKASMILVVGIVLLVWRGSALAWSQDRPAATNIRQAIGDVSVFWDEFDWGNLTCGKQALWTVLGWDTASWQGEAQYPVSEFKTWRDLTEREQAAAVLLGYSEELWDADPEGFWAEFDWEKFPVEIQALWEVLGWNEASWQGEADEPASEAKPWNELTEEERAVAEKLGYDEDAWDG